MPRKKEGSMSILLTPEGIYASRINSKNSHCHRHKDDAYCASFESFCLHQSGIYGLLKELGPMRIV